MCKKELYQSLNNILNFASWIPESKIFTTQFCKSLPTHTPKNRTQKERHEILDSGRYAEWVIPEPSQSIIDKDSDAKILMHLTAKGKTWL